MCIHSVAQNWIVVSKKQPDNPEEKASCTAAFIYNTWTVDILILLFLLAHVRKQDSFFSILAYGWANGKYLHFWRIIVHNVVPTQRFEQQPVLLPLVWT